MKKVAIIENSWGKYISYAWIDGCKRYIRENNIPATIFAFNSFGDFNFDDKFNIGECNIFNLPDLTEFDGIIVELTNVPIPEVKQAILQRVIESGVPAVSLIEEVPGLYFAGIDNYGSMCEMVEHIITEHGAKTLNFVGGPEEGMENQLRFKAYKDTLRKHGIKVDPERIYHGDFEMRTGTHAFLSFLGKKLIPDAFICANDNIAVGLCHQAKKQGYSIPDDFLVTGFDNFDKASYYTPRISTVGFSREDISYSAMDILAQLWSGKETVEQIWTRTECVFQESCGCKGEKNNKTRNQYVIDKIFEEDSRYAMDHELSLLKRAILNCNNFHEMSQCLPSYLYNLQFDDLFIVINKDLFEADENTLLDNDDEKMYRTKGYPDEMELLIAINKRGVIDGLKWSREQLVPTGVNGTMNDVYLFCPIHFRDREIGYMIWKNCHELMNSLLLFEVIGVFLDSMENLYQRMSLSQMNKELSRLYIRDSLTGLYNRMAYSKIAQPAFEKCKEERSPFAVLFIDMDDLKYINDTFGHDMGNLAIKSVAEVIQKVCPEYGIGMRYGGDEFVILVPACDENDAAKMSDEINVLVAQKEQELKAEFPIGVSVGYASTNASGMALNECIDVADQRMYANKKARKEAKKRALES